MSVRALWCGVVIGCVVAIGSPAWAQTPAPQPAPPPPPPPVWKAQASAGLALTSGNSDTSTVTGAYDVTYDPHQKNVIKSDALFLRGETGGTVSANRFNFDFRDEYALNARVSVFAQTQYLHDTFKDIRYLVAPTGGLDFHLANSKTTQADVSAGAGGVWEGDTGLPTTTSGAVTLGEKVTQALTATTTFAESVNGLWKTDDFGDSLYTAVVSVAASMSTHTQLKLEADDTFKNKPSEAGIKKNDVSVLVSFVFKI